MNLVALRSAIIGLAGLVKRRIYDLKCFQLYNATADATTSAAAGSQLLVQAADRVERRDPLPATSCNLERIT